MTQLPKDPEPIAVVGIGCRMPGDVRSPSDLWKLLMSKRIANTAKVPESRFNIDAYLHPSNERPGSFNVSGGYFLEDDVEAFDPGLFRISPVEALWMDPQQRKLLEVVYEAFESAGATLQDVGGRKTGCFIGCFTSDYLQMASKEPDFRHAYVSTGVDPGILGNRISYVFDLKGPSVTINTACSSSLYALDAACKAIITGECESAVVGGTNLLLTVDQQMNTARLGVLSPTNQCHTFDEAADGYGRAEGVGALYLKTLSAALRDGDPIRAVVRSTATGSNGKSKDGMTHPSVQGQMEVIASAYQRGNISPDDTSYVECHGTGTPVGDPIEVEAISRAMGDPKSRTRPILIGSIKPNIGHSEAASSMGTMIKTILALENGILPPTAGIQNLSKAVPWDELNAQVITKPTHFPTSQPLRRIGVSAFGYGGTNAHAIFESATTAVPGYRRHKFMKHAEGVPNGVFHIDPDADRSHLLLFSAHDELTLKNNITDYSMSLSEADMIDLAYTLGVRRSKHSERTFAIARKESLEEDIRTASSNFVSAPMEPVSLAFVFTGQGAQWAQMGASLLTTYPSVLKTIRTLDQYLSALSDPPSWTIEAVMMESEETSVIGDPEYSQPLCTAVQIALVDLIASWGVNPSATIGHSSGEIAAAYAAGRTSARRAITVAYFRGKVAASLRSDGAMLAVGMGADEAIPYLDRDPYRGRIVAACHNSPSSTTLSGDADAVEDLKKELDDAKIFARVLRTSGKAYHSHHMKEASARYLQYLENESIGEDKLLSQVPMFSTVTSKQLRPDGQTILDSYWVDNLNSPVRFNQGVRLLMSTMPEINLFVEIGPHAALAGPLRQIFKAANKPTLGYLPTLKRKEHDGDKMLELAGHLWEKDVPIDISTVTGVESVSKDGSIEIRTGSLLVDLPTYHWTYSKPCWTESRFSNEHRKVKEARHDILGRRIIGMSDLEPAWRNVLRQKDLPWLAQHRLGGEVMLPAAGYLALAMEAITQVNAQSASPLEIQSYTLRDVIISTATVVPDEDEGTETMFRLQPLDGSAEISKNGTNSQWYQFTASCSSYRAWKETARGKIALNVRGRSTDNTAQELEETPNRADHIDWLNKLREVGFDLGPAFHHIRDIYTNGKTHVARGDMTISDESGMLPAESRYVLHPTALDSCLQPFLATIHQGRIEDLRCGTIPTHFSEATIFPPSKEQLANRCTLQVWTPQLGNRAFHSNTQLIGYNGQLIADMTGCRNLLYSAAVPQEMRGNLQKDLYIKLDWKLDADYLGWASDAGVIAKQPIATAVDTILHKDTKTRVLCLYPDLVPAILELRPNIALTVAVPNEQEQADLNAKFSDHENLAIAVFDAASEDIQLGSFDLVLSSNAESQNFNQLRKLTAIGGRLLVPSTPNKTTELANQLHSAGFSGNVTLADSAILTTATDPTPAVNGVHTADYTSILLVYADSPTSLLSVVSDKLTNDGWNIRSEPIQSVQPTEKEHVILLADTEGPFLSHLTGEQLEGLKKLTETVSAMTWVTCGGLLTGDRPEFGMTAGAARVIRNEKGSLDLVTLDFDVDGTPESRVAQLLADVVERQRVNGRNGETEYYVKNGAVYVGRLVSHSGLNGQFVPDSGETTVLRQSDKPAVQGRLDNGKVTFHRDDVRVAEPLGDEEVEVHVEAIGLSPFDGSDDTGFLNHEMAGTVTRVGSHVKSISSGARVMGLAFEKLATFQRTSSKLIQELPPDCSMEEAATLPSAFATAIYGLEELAMVERGENVAIVDDLGATSLAAIQLCRILEVNPIVVTSSASAEEFAQQHEALSGVPIISSLDGSLNGQILKRTGGKGLHVILCSATSEESVVVECGQQLASLGRLLTVGHSVDFANASASLSQIRGLSSFQFDLKDVAERRPRIMARVLERCMELYRDGQIKPIGPLTVKRPAEINQTLYPIPSGLKDGKSCISFTEDAPFKTAPSRMPLHFRDDVTYLMVGCLGGLGRQVALWMGERGAKHLAFVSRTGADSPAAAEVISSLQNKGVEALALRANITDREEVARVVTEVNPAFPIRGVVNAANVLHDVIFSNMTVDAWKYVADTKVKGCLNLHDVLKDEPLDFFVMTSSITSTLGSTGQSNYGAANAFLDSLACHRHSRGLAAVSLILPAVFGIGYIADHPEIEQSIKSKGMYGIYEKEMLEAFEVAMTPQHALPQGVDHVAVGIQPRLFGRAIRASGAHMPWKEDPRLNWMEIACNEHAESGAAGGSSNSENILATIKQAASPEQAVEAVVPFLTQRLARLLMIPLDSIHPTQKSVASYGLDSMIGAEFRNWIFREFGVDMPFQQLLAGSLTISDLASQLRDKVLEGKA